MRKMLFILMLFLSLVLAGNVMGFGGYGELDLYSSSMGGAIDKDHTHIWDGGAYGISGAGGLAVGNVGGFIINGTIEGEVGTKAGGLTNTTANRGFYFFENGVGLYVSSASENYAVTGGNLKIKVDPSFHGFGMGGGHLFGIAAQGSLNGSYVGDGPVLRADGFSTGKAYQGSLGGFSGGVFAVSGPDYIGVIGFKKISLWRHINSGRVMPKPFKWHPDVDRGWEFVGFRCVPIFGKIDSKAGAKINAEIEMIGGSSSLSWRELAIDGNVRTEAMGTQVDAYTTVNTTRFAQDRDRGLGYGNAYLCGFWVAGGGAYSTTQIGGATAVASGQYFGAGSIGQNYEGSATGYTNGSVTTVNGMQGQVVSANAGMSVTSIVSGKPQGYIDR